VFWDGPTGGIQEKDNAILVNFGLQIPLFLIGYINLMGGMF